MNVTTVGVVGAGQMGSGIAHVAAAAGLSVVLVDVGEDLLDKGRATIDRNLEREGLRAPRSASR